MHASTVVVQASVLPEAFGLVTLEGMAAGKPVIATRCGGAAEIIADGLTGILIPPGQPAVLAERIVDLLADPDRREALGAAARTVGFTAADTARRIEASWEAVAARPHPAPRRIGPAARSIPSSSRDSA
jgi:glycosyltransferase involved in cell wall biosynthesis